MTQAGQVSNPVGGPQRAFSEIIPSIPSPSTSDASGPQKIDMGFARVYACSAYKSKINIFPYHIARALVSLRSGSLAHPHPHTVLSEACQMGIGTRTGQMLTFVDKPRWTASKSLSTSRLFVFHSSKLVVLCGCASVSMVILSKFCSNKMRKKDISL